MGISEAAIRNTVLTELAREGFLYVPAGISVRHVHLSGKDLCTLFGAGHELHPLRALVQPGQFAAEETVTLKGPKGELRNVRIIGPARQETQVELSLTDALSMGMKNVPVRMSGDLENTPGIEILGPAGSVFLHRGVIAAARHLHMSMEQARIYGLHDGKVVSLRTGGERSLMFENVVLRVGDSHELEFHVDTDEANACGLKNGDYLEVIVPGGKAEEDPRFPLVPERVAKRAVYHLTGQEGHYSQDPVRTEKEVLRKGPEMFRNAQPSFREDPEENLLDLVTEQDINQAFAKGLRQVFCTPKALITPAARDRAREKNMEIVRDTNSKVSIRMMPGKDTPVLDLITAQDLSAAIRDDTREVFCTEKALITPAAQERIRETGIRIIRVDR